MLIDCKIDEINSVIRVYNSDETTNEVEISVSVIFYKNLFPFYAILLITAIP